jgi:hypothetical protein
VLLILLTLPSLGSQSHEPHHQLTWMQTSQGTGRMRGARDPGICCAVQHILQHHPPSPDMGCGMVGGGDRGVGLFLFDWRTRCVRLGPAGMLRVRPMQWHQMQGVFQSYLTYTKQQEEQKKRSVVEGYQPIDPQASLPRPSVCFPNHPPLTNLTSQSIPLFSFEKAWVPGKYLFLLWTLRGIRPQ